MSNFRSCRRVRALLSCAFVIGLLTSMAPAAFAGVMYSFSGEITYSNIPEIPVGTAFSGVFSYDLAAPLTSQGANFAYYATGAIDASLLGGSLRSGSGQTEVATALTIGLSTGMWDEADLFHIVGHDVTTFGPLASLGITDTIVAFALPLNTFGDLSLPSSISSGSVLGADFMFFGMSGNSEFTGASGALTVGPAAVPEPTGWLLVGPALAGLAMRRQIARRSRARH